MRPIPPGQMVAGYDLDANRVILPEHVRKMKWKAKQRWMDERGLVPAVGGAAGYGSSFLQMLEPFQVADSAQLSNSVTETVVTSETLLTLPPNFFAYPGKQCWFRAAGVVSNVVTTPGTVTFRLRYAAPPSATPPTGTVLTNSGAIGFNPVAATNNMFYVEAWLTALATGPLTTSLTLLSYGERFLANSLAGVADIRNASMPPALTALASVTALDGTVGRALSLSAAFSVATSPTNLTVRNAFIVALN